MEKKEKKGLFLAWILSVVPVFLLLIGTQSHSEILEKKPLYWFNPGIGIIAPLSGGDEAMPSAHAGMNFQYGYFMASTHFKYLTDWEFKEGIYDIGVLIGLATRNKEDHCSFTTGLARLGTSEYSILSFITEFQAFQKFSDNIGAGITFCANKNEYFFSIGISANLVVGLLK